MINKTIDINESTIKKYVESLRPENLEIRKQVDIGYSYDGKTDQPFLFPLYGKILKEFKNDDFPVTRMRFRPKAAANSGRALI